MKNPTPPSRGAAAALVSAIAFLGAVSMAPAEEIKPPELTFEKFVLGNGLNVILHEDHSTPVVAVDLWYHVGSKNEHRGKTGFAHLFEHMMFQGSEHHDTDYIESVEPLGSTSLNGTTNFDRTNYFEVVPVNALERILWQEADRMGWLLPAMTQERLDNQREVVKNERRQSVDNVPYGKVDERMYAALYPMQHPYSWDVIGSMDDLTAASRDDVAEFFKAYYTPNNCTLVIAGDIDKEKTKALVKKYFGPIPPGPPVYRMREWIPELSHEVRLSMEDRVPLPRLYVAWHSPALYKPGDAEMDLLAGILSTGKASRLYKKLVYDLQIAQDVRAYQDDREIGSLFFIVVTAREGHSLDEIEPLVLGEVEKIKQVPPSAEEVDRARTGYLANFVRGLERVGGFGSKADRLAAYNTYTGDPGYLDKDFARYQNATPESISAAARRWLHDGRVVMRVTPFADHKAAAEPAGFDRSKEPAVGQPPALKLPSLQHATLSNGLPVILAETHKIPVVQLNLIARGGASADAKGRPGVASFMARMEDEGTTSRSALQISEEAEKLAIRMRSNCGIDTCTVSLNTLKAKLAPALDLWSDVLLHPSFPQEEIDRQRQEVLGVILQEKKRPFAMGLRILPGILFGPDHPYGQPLTGSGTEESVNAMTRKDLVSYHEKWFQPQNATLVVVGDTTLAELTPLLEARLNDWKAGKTPKIEVPDRPQLSRTTVYLIDKPGAVQSVILVGQLEPPRNDPQDTRFDVMNAVLGGEFSSRINMNLREDKGYTYGAYGFKLDAVHQGMYLAFAPVRTNVTKEALSELMKELRDIGGRRPPTAKEVKVAQDTLTLSLPGQYETIAGISGKIDDVVTYGLPEDFYAHYADAVRAETPASLTKIADERIQPDHMAIVVVGDRASIEKGIRELNLGPIEYLDTAGHPLEERPAH